ncbi:MAG: DNA polymerase III subunit gamma/tau [Patescibacteria group bacterium]
MTTLYRLYRPTDFGEVIGQEHIRQVLQNTIAKQALGQAYLFSGPRGSGKTTVARLLAKAANCLKPSKTGNPCNTCASCQEIINGQSVDVLEIDAASNRGIDEIRELRERVNFTPVAAKFKVYIIDEVHMLTREAFNALLKTLEEPPAHAIFILATTELHKVPETIISRCQRFAFHRASDQELQQLLEQVVRKEKIALAKEAFEPIIRRAEGSYRDALSLLGSLSAHGGAVSHDQALKLLGLPPQQLLEGISTALEQGDTAGLHRQLIAALEQGHDLVILTKVLSDHYKKKILQSVDAGAGINRDAAMLEQLLLGLARSRHSSDPTGSVLARLLSICSAIGGSSADNLVPAKPIAAPAEAAQVKDLHQPTQAPSDSQKPAETTNVDAVTSPAKPVEGAEEFWSAFLHEMKQHNHALYMLLRSAVLLDLTDEKLLLAVRFRFYSERLFEAKNRKLIEASAEKLLGKKITLECEVRSIVDTGGGTNDDLVNAVVDVFELEEATHE